MMRLLAATSLIAGFTAGLLPLHWLESTGPTGQTLVPILTPPARPTGGSPLLTCGWHTACVSPYDFGTGLDWDDYPEPSNREVYFRGYFQRTNTPNPIKSLRGQPLSNSGGPNTCERQDVWIIEVHSGKLRAVPRYVHMDLTWTTPFDIWTSTYGKYQSVRIGVMSLDDRGGCQWTAMHVHEEHAYVGSGVTVTLNTSRYVTAAQCHSSCDTYRNDLIDNWTRKFQWAEGS